jgi:hypothetical protein
MVSPGAERMRRMRAHQKDDHSLCLPDNCEYAQYDSLPRGQQLETDLLAERVMSTAEKELVRAIAHTADEIDDLESYLVGRRGRWLSTALEQIGDAVAVTVNVDNALAVLDRKRGTLTRLMSELRQYGVAAARAAATGPAGPSRGPSTGPAGPSKGVADDLAAIRRRAAERRRAT